MKTLEERLWCSVSKTPTCWNWVGQIMYDGYGRFYAYRRHHAAHRFLFEYLRGKVPDGLVLDHLCRNRGCVNPDHLEPVTPRENVMRGVGPVPENARKAACMYGHPLSGENLIVWRNGKRACRTCRKISSRQQTERRRMRREAMADVVLSGEERNA